MNHRPETVEILELFRSRGHSQYGREAVTQQDHALQAAYFAERASASPSLIAAALLHDVGHLLHDLSDDAPELGIDDVHETLGARWLEQRYGIDVVEPVRLHVAAKRYLCSVEQEYFSTLSPASVLSLKLQGGPMSDDEAREFRSHLHFADAIALRRWDDAAKIPDLETPNLEHFARYLDQALAKI